MMNTWVERPAIETRLLFWLPALHGINGMLYYDVAYWSTSFQCPGLRPCKPVGRINRTAFTDFDVRARQLNSVILLGLPAAPLNVPSLARFGSRPHGIRTSL